MRFAKVIFIGILGLFLLTDLAMGQAVTNWHYPLYMPNLGYWHSRFPIIVQNLSTQDVYAEPVKLEIDSFSVLSQLVGCDAAGFRVVDSKGAELLWRINSPDGQVKTDGIILNKSTLVIPATLKANTSEIFYIYFNNTSAWPLIGLFKSHNEVVNSGFELADAENNPLNWWIGKPEKGQKITSEFSHSGEHCLRLENKFQTEFYETGSKQSNIFIQGGARYRLNGWIKAESVKGKVGLRLVAGDVASYDDNFKMQEMVLDAGSGSYDWKYVSGEFTAPQKANSANIYTVLEGAGVAWFDDIELTCLAEDILNIRIQPAQNLILAKDIQNDAWPSDSKWDIRVPLKVFNFSDTEFNGPPVYVNMEQIMLRLHEKVNNNSPCILNNGSEGHLLRFEKSILYDSRVSPQSEKTDFVYFTSNEKHISANTYPTYKQWVNDRRNLVNNPDISVGESHWQRIAKDIFPENAVQKVVQNAIGDEKSFFLQIPKGTIASEIGWNQAISIKPGRKYLFSAMAKCTEVSETISLNISFQADSETSFKESVQSSKITGTTDWTLVSGVFNSPEKVSFAQLNLILSSPGEVWFKDILMLEVVEGYSSSMFFDQRDSLNFDAISAWPVNPIIKVFNDDLPPQQIKPARISVARNEAEPLQIALRSRKACNQMTVEIVAPENAEGRQLNQYSVSLVGYVPVNFPSNYFRTNVPYWHLKYPTEEIGSDGWAGYWPDPLLPNKTFCISANSTQPIWIEVTIPEGTAHGDYTGKILIYQKDSLVKTIPWYVHVWDFALPENKKFGAVYDYRSVGNMPESGQDQFSIEEQGSGFEQTYWPFMAKHRISTGAIIPSPVISFEKGLLSADFTEFDKAATYYFDVLKNPFAYFPNELFYIFGWAFPPNPIFGENPYPGIYPYEKADRSKLRSEYKTAYQKALRAFWNHAKEKGWDDNFILYISDEPHEADHSETGTNDIDKQMKALCDMIHEVDKKIPIYVSTWWYRPEWKWYIDVWGLGYNGDGDYGHGVTKEDIKQITSSGGRIWYTTDGNFCTETPYMSLERLLPHFAYKFGAEAYEFWGVNWITNNPFKSGTHDYIFESQGPGEAFWIRYPNGDGFIIYPGKPIGEEGFIASIRLKQVREGIEDFEYLSLLDQLIKLAQSKGLNVDNELKTMALAQKLVDIPCAMGRYSTKILPNPDDVLSIREQLAKSIEILSQQKNSNR